MDSSSDKEEDRSGGGGACARSLLLRTSPPPLALRSFFRSAHAVCFFSVISIITDAFQQQ